MLTNPERAVSCALFCKSIFTKPLIFESTLSVFNKLFRSCALELCVVASLVLRMFVSVLASENFLSKSPLSTPVAPRLKTKALLLMNADRCKGIAEALGFADVLSCK
ncbi:hypothetical protein BSPLISOX_1174 [uncultured Gammaproteobacteria bacterium]|nr:hypothetical protein BSPLISOX_1599 [uncultured Gammaproteobacteria bacterium]VVH65785.1 hypothetical protein BSPLISOX_1242 [uncultured Gammaproteobacteria bacterium]VVH65813.1 hypothetical protein BSPLISOX_1174 [uncultured Gammaproteobacteria bacterium]